MKPEQKDFAEAGTIVYEQGRVTRIDGEYAWVETQRKSACGGCQSSEGCGTGSLAKLFTNNKSSELKVLNHLNAQPGQQVRLSLNENLVVKHAFMAYGMPLVGLLIGSMLLQTFGHRWLATENELFAIVGGVFGMLGAWWLTHVFYQPIMPEMQALIQE